MLQWLLASRYFPACNIYSTQRRGQLTQHHPLYAELHRPVTRCDHSHLDFQKACDFGLELHNSSLSNS